MEFKHTYNINTNSIILSSCLFGSIYLFSTSLIAINKKWLKREPSNINTLIEGTTFYELLNGTILIVSGVVITATSYKALNLINKC